MTTLLQVRVDQKTKQRAQKTFASMGLNLSSGVNLFLNQVVKTQSIPFPILTAENFSPAKKRRLLAEAKESLKGEKGYRTAREMHQAILG